jgi:hypothetical protein
VYARVGELVLVEQHRTSSNLHSGQPNLPAIAVQILVTKVVVGIPSGDTID